MLSVWRFYDGKAGHDRQTLGLLEALAAATTIESVAFDVREYKPSLLRFLTGRLDYGEHAPAPDLIIGAGRRCQWPILRAKYARGGSAVYLMKPHFPSRCFDLCLIPRHDQPKQASHIIITDGVLNNVSASPAQGHNGLLLIGGPSDHYAWDSGQLIQQIQAVIDVDAAKKWVIADSRRTPPETSTALRQLLRDNVSLIGYQDSDSDALNKLLSCSDTVWVSCDSVSMIYEALTAGAAVGVLGVPAKRADRITAIVPDLVARNLITTFTDWQRGGELQTPPKLAEAARCASIILARWDPKTRRLRSKTVE